MKHYLEVMRDERYLNLYVEGDREMEGPKFINKGIIIGEQRGRQEGIVIGEQRGRQEGIAIGEQRGITIGEQKARREERIKQVQRMAARGLSVPEIADFTDIPIEEIKDIITNSVSKN